MILLNVLFTLLNTSRNVHWGPTSNSHFARKRERVAHRSSLIGQRSAQLERQV